MAVKVRLPRQLVSALEQDGFVVERERERKYLVDRTAMPDLSNFPHVEIRQAYYKHGPSGHWIRTREIDAGREHIVTIKEPVPDGDYDFERREAQHPITKAEFDRIMGLSEGRALSKTRYMIPYKGRTIELDVYHNGTGTNDLKGLLTAEVEFESMEALSAFVPPKWFGKEVSHDKRYRSRKLAKYGIPEGYHEEELAMRLAVLKAQARSDTSRSHA